MGCCRSGDRFRSDTLTLTTEFLSEMLGRQRTTVNLMARELSSGGSIRYREAGIGNHRTGWDRPEKEVRVYEVRPS